MFARKHSIFRIFFFLVQIYRYNLQPTAVCTRETL